MKRILALLLLLPSVALADCTTIEWPFATAGTLRFAAYSTDGATRVISCASVNGTATTGDITISETGTETVPGFTVTDDGRFCSIPITAAQVDGADGATLIDFDDTDTDTYMPFCIRLNYRMTLYSFIPDATGETTTNVRLPSTFSSTNDFYNNNWLIVVTAGTGVGQASCITDYIGATRDAVVALTTALDTTSRVNLIPQANCNVTASSVIPASGVFRVDTK